MGTCSQEQNPAQERSLLKIVMYFYNIPMQQYPDIDSLIIKKLDSLKIIERGLSKNVIEEIILFLNSRYIRNPEQEELLSHFNYIYQQTFKKLKNRQSLLERFILTASIEVLLCYKSLEMQDLTDMDVWWVKDHFEWRYHQLNEIYHVEYDEFLESNYLIKFLYLLKESARLELKKGQFELALKIPKLKWNNNSDLPQTTRTPDSYKQHSRRLDTC